MTCALCGKIINRKERKYYLRKLFMLFQTKTCCLCFDIEFRRHASTRWEVYFDIEDMTKAVAVNEDGTRRFMLEEKYIQPMWNTQTF